MSNQNILAKSPYVIYRPGGTPGGLVVTTWAQVQKFIAARQGAVTVYVDSSIVSPALVDAATGVTECFGRVVFQGALIDSLSYQVLQIEAGATLQNPYEFVDLNVACNTTTAVPALSFTSAPYGGFFALSQYALLTNTATATMPAVAIAPGKTLLITMNVSGVVLHAPTVPFFNVPASAVLNLDCFDGSGVPAGFASGAGSVNLFYDNASAAFFTPPGVVPALPGPGFTGTYFTQNVDNIWVNKVLDSTTMGAPAVNNVPIFNADNTWHAGPPPLGPVDFGAIIYRPGVASAGDAVETWPEVQAFVALADGKCIVYVDDSTMTPAPVPGATGVTACFGRVELRPYSNDPTAQTVLQIQAGATLLDLYAVRGRLELQCNPSVGAVSLDWTINADGGSLLLADNAILSNLPTAGESAVSIADGKTVSILLQTASILIGNPDHPIFSIADGGLLVVQAFDGSRIENGYASGNGAVSLFYDMASASNFDTPGTPAQATIGSLYLTKNLDDIIVEQTFTTSTINNNIFQNGPATGIRPVTFKGLGGGGGGGGGSGGSATSQGTGGSAGGAAAYQEVTVDVDFSHPINVVVDAGGPGGAGGTGGGAGGVGANGTDGGPTYVLDTTTNIVLCAFMGASAGQGSETTGGGPFEISSPGSNISGAQYAEGTGFVGAGGMGSVPGTNGIPGAASAVSIGALMGPPDFSPVWLPGAGGTSGDSTQGGGGGGGGQGPYGSGGDGGNCIGGVVTNGNAAAAQSGAGGGGGAGGPINGDGSSGGNGGSAQITSSYRP